MTAVGVGALVQYIVAQELNTRGLQGWIQDNVVQLVLLGIAIILLWIGGRGDNAGVARRSLGLLIGLIALGIAVSGKAADVGTFFAPTVLTDVDNSMAIMREETFGPTLPIVKVADEEEAIRLANDTDYGLSATVWTRDYERGERIARRLDAGGVNINDMASNLFSFALPMAGWKKSGFGSRSGGADGLLKYCRPQAITAPRLPVQSNEVMWYPYSRRKTRLAMGIMRASAAHGLRRLGIKPKGGRR